MRLCRCLLSQPMCRSGRALVLMSSIGAFQELPARASDRRVEDIYIARSLRESRVTATDFCAEEKPVSPAPDSRTDTRFD